MPSELELFQEGRKKLPPPHQHPYKEIPIDLERKDDTGNFITYSVWYRKDDTHSRWNDMSCIRKSILGDKIPTRVKKAMEECAKEHYAGSFAEPFASDVLTCLSVKGFKPETDAVKFEWIYYAVKVLFGPNK